MLLIVPSYPDPTGVEPIRNAAVRVVHYEVGRTDDWGRVTARVYRSAAIATADATKQIAEFRVVLGGWLVEATKPSGDDPGDPGIRFPSWTAILAEVDTAQAADPTLNAVDLIDRSLLTHLAEHPSLTGATLQA